MNKPTLPDEFIPARDDPKIVRARILKDPTRSRWYGKEPHHGWDNPCDVEDAKQYCENLFGWCRRAEEDVPKIGEIATHIRELGVSEMTCLDLILTFNRPPFAKARVELEVWKAYEYAYNEPGKRSLAQSPDARKDKWTLTEEDEDDSWLENGLAALRVWPRQIHYDAQQRSNAKLAVEFLSAREQCGGGKLIYSAGQFFTLDSAKLWRVLPDEQLAAEIRQTDIALILDAPRIFAMVGALKLSCFTTANPFEWIERPVGAPAETDLILFKNGILDFESGELRPHDGSYFATGFPDFNYDKAATCPLWKEKLNEWLHPSYIPTLQEFVGYSMTCDTSAEVLLAMIGVTRAGKGTICDVMQNLVGTSLYCARTLNGLAGDYALQGTLDKRLLFIPDAHNTDPSKRAAVLERIKSITGRDAINVNRKFLEEVTIRIPVRIVVVANQLPKFLDESGAFAARMLVLKFDQSFKGREDRELRSKLRAELPGIANWALEGLRCLRANGNRFTVGKKGEAAARDANLSQSPALRFARDCLNVTGGKDYTDPDLLFKRYHDWASCEEKLSPREIQNRTDFKASLLAALTTKGVRYGLGRLPGDWEKRPRGWWGFLMLDTWDEEGATWTAKV